jgi:hypothetical protein
MLSHDGRAHENGLPVLALLLPFDVANAQLGAPGRGVPAVKEAVSCLDGPTEEVQEGIVGPDAWEKV